MGGRDPRLEQCLVGRLRPIALGPVIDREGLAVRAADAVDDTHPPRRRGVQVAALAGRAPECREGIAPFAAGEAGLPEGPLDPGVALIDRHRRRRFDDLARSAAQHEGAAVVGHEARQPRRVTGLDERRQRRLELALTLEPLGGGVVQVADLRRRQRQPSEGVFPDQAVQREPSRFPGEWLEEQCSTRQLLEGRRRARHANRVEERRREPVEVDRVADEHAGFFGGAGHDLLRQVSEDRPLGPAQPVEDGLPVGPRRGPVRLDGQPDRRRPAARRGVDPRRGRVAQRRRPGAVRPRRTSSSARISSTVKASAVPPTSTTWPWPRSRSTANGTSAREVTTTWSPAGARRTRASTNRSDPVAPARTWRSSRTRTRSASSADWIASVTSAAAADARAMIAASSVGSIELSTAVDVSSGIDGRRSRSDALTPAANEPMWRSDGSSVYQAVGRVAATRAASVDFPKPAPPMTIVSRRWVPARRFCSRTGLGSVPTGSAGGNSLADRPPPARATSPRRSPGSPESILSRRGLTASGSAVIGSPASRPMVNGATALNHGLPAVSVPRRTPSLVHASAIRAHWRSHDNKVKIRLDK